MELILGLVVVLAVLILGVVLLGSYNLLQLQAQRVREGASNITVSLRMRTDLASQLFQLIGEHGVHENYIHSAVAQLEGGAGSAGAIGDVSTVLAQMTRAYPDLKANETYTLGMQKMQEIELALQQRREKYNKAVTEYNSIRNGLPMILYANALGFKEAEYFSDDNADRLTLFRTDSGDMLRAAIADVSKAVGAKAKELGVGAADKSRTLGTTTLSRGKELTNSTVERAKQLTEAGGAKAKELGVGAAERSVALGTTTLARGRELTNSTVERAKRVTEAGRAKLPLRRRARKDSAAAEAAASEPEGVEPRERGGLAEPPATRTETEVNSGAGQGEGEAASASPKVEV